MARVLIVGCGCRGQALARELVAAGHAVRGTTRDRDRVGAIEASGAQAVLADPDRAGTIMGQLAGVSVLCWVMGSVPAAAARELHGPRLRSLLEALVDTPVRGVVYEGAGGAPPGLLAAGAQAVREAAETWRMPAEIVAADPGDHDDWIRGMLQAVNRLLEI